MKNPLIKYQYDISRIPAKAFSNAYAISSAFITSIFTFNLDKYIKLLSPNQSSEDAFLVITLGISSTIFNLIGYDLLKRWYFGTSFLSWPRYVVYVFEIRPRDYIIGWCKIDLDRMNKAPFASGYSYSASPAINLTKLVRWDSQSVAIGSKGEDDYSIIYNLDPDQAKEQKRPYKKGLLLFRILQEKDMRQRIFQPAIPKAVERYTGQQQGIDRNGVFNVAYAEQVIPEGSTNVEIANYLDNLIWLSGSSLIKAHQLLKES
jgi:hypothetical protein